MAQEYLASGAADEITLARNRAVFDSRLLNPRVLRDVGTLSTSVELLGTALAHPILLAPTAYHRLFHKQGELATADGAADAGAVYVVSSFATISMEKIAARTKMAKWFQLYTPPDRSLCRDLIRRAEAAGYLAICLTVDTAVLGTRNREVRCGFELPRGMRRENLVGYDASVTRGAHFDRSGRRLTILNSSLTWDYVGWIRSETKLPVLLKGILAPEDARLAVEHGAAAIVVSNHGGRNLDSAPATLEALPAVARTVAGRIPVLFDGGIRRGTDVLKALALGAGAVLIGRPYLYGLAVSGAKGVSKIVEILVEELRTAMALCGVDSLAQADRSVLWEDGK